MHVIEEIEDGDLKAIKSHHEGSEKHHSKRAIGEDGGDERPKTKKNKKKRGSTSSTTASPMSSSTDTTTSAGNPSTLSSTQSGSTTEGPSNAKSTTKKPDSGMGDLDDDNIAKLVKDQAEEKALLEKADQAFRDWVGWIESHNKRTLNRYRASQLVRYVFSASRKYIIIPGKRWMMTRRPNVNLRES